MVETDPRCSPNKPHVAVFAFPFGSHAAALLILVRKLAAAASDVRFSFFSTAKSNGSIMALKGDDIDNLQFYDVADGIPENYVLTGNPLEEIELFLKATPENFKNAVDMAVAKMGGSTMKKISCVMSDAFLWFSGEMAEEMGVPWVPFWTSGAFSLSTHFYTDVIRHAIGVAGCEDEPLNFIPGMSALRVRDLQEGILVGNLKSSFSCMLHRMGQMMPRANIVIINSFQELETAILDDLKSNFQKCLTLGPMNLMFPPQNDLDASGCLQWLDGHKPASVAYVGFGRVATPPPHELAALAEALEATGTPFLWSLKDSLKVHLPDGFLDRMHGKGMVVPWAPQSQVLEHAAVGVFVTHCGWNSVWESVMGGVPMICRPFFGDHRLNGRMVTDVWGIGIIAKDGVLSKDGVVNALDLILSSKEEGRKMREKVGALKELTEQAVKPEGSSFKNFNILLEKVSTL